MGATDLNSGPDAYMAGTVLTVLSAPWEVVSKSGFAQMTLSGTKLNKHPQPHPIIDTAFILASHFVSPWSS